MILTTLETLNVSTERSVLERLNVSTELSMLESLNISTELSEYIRESEYTE